MTQETEKRTIVVEKPVPSKAMFIDFETEQEEWNKYLLEDRTLLRVKLILTGVLTDKTLEELTREAKSSQKLIIGLGLRSYNVLAVESPLKVRGPPDSRKYSLEELRASIVKKELDFETRRETWNSYLFENGMRMKARISPTSVHRTNKFDSGGMPVYLVDFATYVKLELPETIEEIQKTQEKTKKKQRVT